MTVVALVNKDDSLLQLQGARQFILHIRPAQTASTEEEDEAAGRLDPGAHPVVVGDVRHCSESDKRLE